MAQFEQGIVVLHSSLGHAKVSVGAVAVPLPNIPTKSRIRRVVIRTVDQPINWADDGTTPNGTTGMFLDAKEILVYDGADVDQLLLIRASTATADADVRVAYYGL